MDAQPRRVREDFKEIVGHEMRVGEEKPDVFLPTLKSYRSRLK